jgi:hypothetical protein
MFGERCIGSHERAVCRAVSIAIVGDTAVYLFGCVARSIGDSGKDYLFGYGWIASRRAVHTQSTVP